MSDLWTDSHIYDAMRKIGGGTRLYVDDAATVARQARDDLKARIAELEAALKESQEYAHCMETDAIDCAEFLDIIAPGHNPSIDTQLQAARIAELERQLESMQRSNKVLNEQLQNFSRVNQELRRDKESLGNLLESVKALSADVRDRVAADHYTMTQTLGKALGYSVEDYGIETGEHVLASLVDEATAQLDPDALTAAYLRGVSDGKAKATRWEPVEIFESLTEGESIGLFRYVAGEGGNE